MSEEIKIVTRQETFNDLAVRELARSRSACICKIQFGRCEKTECAHCAIGKQYKNCYSAMNDYDKNRLASYIGDYYVVDSRSPEQWMDHKHYKRFMFKWIFGGWAVLMAVLFLAIGLCCLVPGDTPPKPDSKLNYAVNETLKISRARVMDFNLDGKINCIDYTISFKQVWDWLFVNFSDNKCVIIRNLSPTMNHLFVAVWYKDRWWEVEPQADPPEDWRMVNVWGDMYKPLFNIYGETDFWMKESHYGYKN